MKKTEIQKHWGQVQSRIIQIFRNPEDKTYGTEDIFEVEQPWLRHLDTKLEIKDDLRTLSI